MEKQLYLFPDIQTESTHAALGKLRRSFFARMNEMEKRIIDLEQTLAETTPHNKERKA